MRSQTLKPLLKLRKHQVEVERWKLASCQVEERDARLRVHAVQEALNEAYHAASGRQRPTDVMNAAAYLADANTLLVVEQSNLATVCEATAKQLDFLVESRRREQMLEKLHEAAVLAEFLEDQAQERKELDDLNQARYALSERKFL